MPDEGTEPSATARVEPVDDLWCRVTGVFYRGVHPEYRNRAIGGSRSPGRYSTAEQPTLYLSSSPQGVVAAMVAHPGASTGNRALVTVLVDADRVLDLRDPTACERAGVDPADAASPWQDVVAAGREPPSWRVRQRLEALGANGLIDPSRRAPGLWHLTLFRWNGPSDPRVRLLGGATPGSQNR